MNKTELEFLISVQKDYYLKILKEGKDGRKNGLIWVIEILAETGTKVTPDLLPKFLDNTSKRFLIDLS